ncbi:MAG TPA: hypothetical protein VK338_05990 [Candidatus Nitrosocosmicus sp.]|nr:hypothetical protein [Candidatus Nitrosocosmicus sp.]
MSEFVEFGYWYNPGLTSFGARLVLPFVRPHENETHYFHVLFGTADQLEPELDGISAAILEGSDYGFIHSPLEKEGDGKLILDAFVRTESLAKYLLYEGEHLNIKEGYSAGTKMDLTIAYAYCSWKVIFRVESSELGALVRDLRIHEKDNIEADGFFSPDGEGYVPYIER